MILPGYVASMGMRVTAGRGLGESDGPDSAAVVMINERLAERTWPGEDPVGKKIVLDYLGGTYAYEIIGVVNDTRYYGLRAEVRPEVFIPYRQNAYPALFVVVKSAGDPATLIAAARKALSDVDANQPAQRIETMSGLVEATLGRERLATALFGAMALIALLLSAVGIWGIVDYAITRSTRDIGLQGNPFKRTFVSPVVRHQKEDRAISGQTAGHEAVPATNTSARGTTLFVSGQSRIGVLLNGFLSRFVANQPARPAVSPGMTQPRSSVMIKPVLKTVSLSFLVFGVAAFAPAAERAEASFDSARFGCSSAAEIERGWEAQQQLVEERLAARGALAVEIPGTIISPPLPGFVPTGSVAKIAKASSSKEVPAPRATPNAQRGDRK